MSKPEEETETAVEFFTKNYPESKIEIIKVCNKEDQRIKQDRKQLEELSAKGYFIP